jgi:hypothetical protein
MRWVDGGEKRVSESSSVEERERVKGKQQKKNATLSFFPFSHSFFSRSPPSSDPAFPDALLRPREPVLRSCASSENPDREPVGEGREYEVREREGAKGMRVFAFLLPFCRSLLAFSLLLSRCSSLSLPTHPGRRSMLSASRTAALDARSEDRLSSRARVFEKAKRETHALFTSSDGVDERRAKQERESEKKERGHHRRRRVASPSSSPPAPAPFSHPRSSQRNTGPSSDNVRQGSS